MAIVALTSSRGSPGVTSLAVGLALSLRRKKADPLLIEADPAGGVLGLRFDLPREPSLATLAGGAGRGSIDGELLSSHTVNLGGFEVLAAPFDGLISNWALNRSTSYLCEVLPSLNRPIILDLGRLDASSAALGLMSVADAAVTVSRSTAEDAQAMMFGVRTLRNHCEQVGLVSIGDKPFVPHEIADLASVPLFAVLPEDRRTSKAFLGGRHSTATLRRSLLWRSIDSLADGLFGSDWGASQMSSRNRAGKADGQFSRPAPTGIPVRPQQQTAEGPPPPPDAGAVPLPPPPLAAVPDTSSSADQLEDRR